MDTNLTAYHMATELTHDRLIAQAAQGWREEQAISTLIGPAGAASVRRRVGGALVRVGERLQGIPRPTISPIGSDLPVPPVRTTS